MSFDARCSGATATTVVLSNDRSRDEVEMFSRLKISFEEVNMEVTTNGGTQNGCFIMEHSIKMDDLEVFLFQETSASWPKSWYIII